MRAVIYVRISRDWKGESLGVQRQEEECRALAASMDATVSRVYVDNDFSASNGKPRPGYRQMLTDMAAGHFDVVIVWIVDRMYRSLTELEELITIAEASSTQFSTVKAGHIDLSTASGRLVARMLGAAARHEIELKSERQVAQKHQAARAGRPNYGGVRPFGWEDDKITVRPEEAAVIAGAIDRVLAGVSLIDIVRWVHATGVPTPAGRTNWHTITVRRILKSPRIAGLATYKGDVVGTGEWEPIIDEATWRRVVERLDRPARRGGREGGRSLLLPEILRCGGCEYGLNVNIKIRQGVKTRVYACRERYIPGRAGYQRSCGRVDITASMLEDDIAERFIAAVSRPQSAALIEAAGHDSGDPAAEHWIGQLALLEDRLREAGEDYAEGLLGRTEFHSARDRLTDKIDEARSRLDVADRPKFPTHSPQALTAWWEAATLAQRRAALRSRISRVTVHRQERRSPRYLPERVVVEWR